MIELEKETHKVVEDFVKSLAERGLDYEIAMVEANEFTSDICQAELLPKLNELANQIDYRNRIIAQLEKKRDIATVLGTNAEVGKIQKAIKEVEIGDFSSAITKKIKKDIDDADSKVKKTVSRKESDLSLQEIIDKYNFHMTSVGGLYWYYQSDIADEFGNRGWYALKKDTLQANFAATTIFIRGGNGEPDYSSYNEFNAMLRDQGRNFTNVIQSYTDKAGCLNVMNKKFCEAAADGSTDYHWIFDAIYESVSGGDPGSEEFNQFQRTVFSKYVNPNNPFLPNLFVKNTDGRCAKDLLAETHMNRLFNGNVAPNCNIDHLLGKFNGAIAGKAVIFVNETVREKVDVEKIKQFLGSKRFQVENKFEMPYSADNTALVISFTNALAGGISLSGTKSDERYSLFSTNKVFREVLSRYFKEKEGIDLTPEECKKWLESNDPMSGQNILRDKVQNGKWINAMHAKWGKVEYVESYHGQVYSELINRQRGAWTDLVEDVFTEPGFTYIRDVVLEKMIVEFCKKEMIPGKRRRTEEIERLCRDKGIDVVLITRAQIKPQTSKQQPYRSTIWKVNDWTKTVDENEYRYGVVNDRGIWEWNWKG